MQKRLNYIGLSSQVFFKKFEKFFFLFFFVFILIFSSSSKSYSKERDWSLVDEDYIKAKLSIDQLFNEDILSITIGQIGAMKKKELVAFKNFMVYCSSFIDLFLKGSHVLYQCRISQRHFKFQFGRDRALDWLIEDMLKGISYVHDETGGSRFKEDFILRKRKIEYEWIRTLNQRYMELDGIAEGDTPQT